MLSYQHAFHAGNHADILKHYVLTFVLSSLNRKDKPYTVFDTHSGSGIYDLFDNRIVKTGEAEKGIKGLINFIEQNKSEPPVEFMTYINFVKKYTDLNLYPGSPEIERCFLRQQDTLVLSELHPQEIINLRENMKHPVIEKYKKCPDDKKECGYPLIKIHNRNGWEMVKALTPPETKRGAVLIDPSYEETQDYIDASKTICEINRKWSSGIIMLWYPLLVHREQEIQTMIETIISSVKNVNKNTEILNLQLDVYSKDDTAKPRLYGSGMLVINAPWKLDEESKVVINYLKNTISSFF